MPIVNYATREIEFKIVFYGPSYAGKTTNLKFIQSRIRSISAGKMVTLNTGVDRTLFFEFVPENTELIPGFRARFQLYTVPGKVVLNAPRQLVLRDVDGLVFVADSRWECMEENVDCLENLEDNLQRHAHPLAGLPMVLQFNKRDLSNIAPLNYLEFLLNRRVTPRVSFPAVARHGEGVFRCLSALTEQIFQDFFRKRPQEQPGRHLRLHEAISIGG